MKANDQILLGMGKAEMWFRQAKANEQTLLGVGKAEMWFRQVKKSSTGTKSQTQTTTTTQQGGKTIITKRIVETKPSQVGQWLSGIYALTPTPPRSSIHLGPFFLL